MLFGAEPRASCDEHTAVYASVKDFLLNVFELPFAVIWVLRVVHSKPDLQIE